MSRLVQLQIHAMAITLFCECHLNLPTRPYQTPEPVTPLEHWCSLILLFLAATLYAWLAGVIVEVVSRAGENTREIDGIFDSIIEYMVSNIFNLISSSSLQNNRMPSTSRAANANLSCAFTGMQSGTSARRSSRQSYRTSATSW